MGLSTPAHEFLVYILRECTANYGIFPTATP
jgi:hypothetical protein